MAKHQVYKQAIPGKLRSLLDRAKKARTRYLATHNPVDLDQALALLNQIIQHPTFAQTPKGFQDGVRRIAASSQPDRKQAIPNELRSLRDRAIEALTSYGDTHNLADHDQALALLNQIIQHPTFAQTPKGFQAEVRGNMAVSLYCHFEHMGDSSSLEQAILYYKQALEVYTRQANPGDWAMTMRNLGAAYRNRIHGDAAENLEQAILHCNHALEVYTRQADPGDWTMIMRNLGAAYLYRIRGDTAENLEQAILYYEQVLEVDTRQANPSDWAMTMGNLGLAYSNRIRGDKAENLEQAIKCSEQALEVYTRQANPGEWAILMNNLGGAYGKRIRGDTAENLEQAIKCSEQALEVSTRQANPGHWANTMNNLGIAYLYRIRGDKAENLEQAIKCSEQALEVSTRQANPGEWAMTMMNLGTAYLYRIRGDKAENLEQAIKCSEQALEVFTRQADPGHWAMTMNHLGAAYRNRIRGDKAENLEQAILYYNHALEVFMRQANPGEWARTMMNLGTAYLYRIRGDKAENLEQAIKCSEQALEVFTRQADPGHWAMTMNNLGNTYPYLIREDKAENLEQAIKCSEQALEVFTRQANPGQWAMTMLNLGNAYAQRIRGDRAENQEQAIKCYEQVLEVFTRQANPGEWAKLMNNLGNTYSNRIRGDKAENLVQAIKYLEQALEVWTPTSYPQSCRDTAFGLGSLLYSISRSAGPHKSLLKTHKDPLNEGHKVLITEARKYLEIAHEAIQNLRKEVKRYEGKQELSVDNAGLYALLVACCLHGDPKDVEAAFTYAVAGKGRAFVDALASPRLTPVAAAKDNPELAADWATAQQLWQELENIRALLTRDGGSGPGQELTQEVIAQLNQDLELRQAKATEHWETMTFKYPALTATLQAPALSANDAKALASACQATLVEYYCHAEGWAAFVVTPTAIRYIPLEIPAELLKRLLELVKRIDSPAYRSPVHCKRFTKLYEAIITPLGIKEGTPLILAPFTQLHRFPLAAARNPDEQYLIDLYPLAFVPSLGALKVIKAQRERDLAQREARPSAPEPTLLSVVYPGEQGSKSYLDSAIPEAQAIMAIFSQPKDLHEAQATPNEVIKQAQEYDLIHFGCHGMFDPANPAQSGLILADAKWLTVQRIITEMRLGQTALVTLGACESGMAAGNGGDELVGLVQGFLLAGTPVVVGSLWSVNDASTKELFITFYQALKSGKAPSQAMLEAVERVRRESKWSHPYYWAAFQAYGLAFGS